MFSYPLRFPVLRGITLITSISCCILSIVAAVDAQVNTPVSGKIYANDASAVSHFGSAASQQGGTSLVGAEDARGRGAAYVIDAAGNQTKLVAIDGADGDNFGTSVSLFGTTALIGADQDNAGSGSNQGSAYLFDITTGQQVRKLRASDGAAEDFFGGSVALWGTTALVGSTNASNIVSGTITQDVGAAYLFNTTTGQQIYKLSPNDAAVRMDFGAAVALSGNVALVGATYSSVNGIRQGAAYLFDTTSGQQLLKLSANDGSARDQFGVSVALYGNYALVGAWADTVGTNGIQGSAYLFDITTGQQLYKFTASDGAADTSFGRHLALSGNFALINSFGYNDNKGSVYLFDITTGQQVTKLTAGDAQTLDGFGSSIALDGTTALVGAPNASPFAYPNSNQQGAVYRFTLTSDAAPEPSALALLTTLLPLAGVVLRKKGRK